MTSAAPSLTAVVPRFPAPSETFIVRKLTGLRDAGFDVTVAATEFLSGAEDFGFALHPLQPASRPRDLLARPMARDQVRSVQTALRLRRRGLGLRSALRDAPLVAQPSEIVHFEFSGVAVAYRDALAHLGPAKIVVSCRGAAEQIAPLTDPRRATMLREVLGRADLIHCVSDDMRRTVEGHGAPRERILVNRPAIPTHGFRDLATDRVPHEGPLRVLSVGRLHWKKGLDDGIRAVTTSRRRGTDIEYRIAGDGPEREKLTFLAHQLGVAEHVQLLGTQDQEQIKQLLRWADVLLLPSLSEGISNAVLEAMAAGLPVIATRSGGMDEVITDDVDGLLVDIGAVDDMADRLLRLAADHATVVRLGRSATTRILDDFDVSRQIDVFVDAYTSLLGR